MTGALPPAFASKLARRRPLSMRPARGPAVKRNLHELTVAAPADAFAGAFRAVMREEARFGLIEVKRVRQGDFVVGERFTGCIRLAQLAARRRGLWRALLGWLSRTRLGAWLEDAFLSDFAEIVALEPNQVEYRYLSGTPLAGRSRFEIAPLSSETCRLRVIFEYQEIGAFSISILHRFGLRMHDEVTALQAAAACARLGVPLLSSTIR
jgi:hypothetical protein